MSMKLPFEPATFAKEMKSRISGVNLTLDYYNIESSLYKVSVTCSDILGAILYQKLCDGTTFDNTGYQEIAKDYLQRALLHFGFYEHLIFLITRIGNDGVTVKKNTDETTLYKYQEDDLKNNLKKNTDGRETIQVKKNFVRNPVPYLKIQGMKFTGRKFNKDIAPFTNITPKEFSDCFDLYSAYNQASHPDDSERCLDKIISILYPVTEDYKENMVSNHIDLISTISPGLKLAIYLWFSSVVEYYFTHPVYSILFRSKQDTDKISLGMGSTVLMAEKKGYDLKYKDLNDFFDIQIKVFQDDLSQAVAYGAKPEELAEKTGLSITDINKLI